MLSDMGVCVLVDFDYLLRVMNSLIQIEGGVSNMWGVFFEFVVGFLVKDVEGGYFKIGEC